MAPTEIFDPFQAIAGFEHSLAISSKAKASSSRRPISGRVLQRLLDIGWITGEEIEERCSAMDIEALTDYNRKLDLDVQEGRGIYPWRALKWESVPTLQRRKELMMKYYGRLKLVTEDREVEGCFLRTRAEEEEREMGPLVCPEFFPGNPSNSNMTTARISVHYTPYQTISRTAIIL
jgi:hypothetical protein